MNAQVMPDATDRLWGWQQRLFLQWWRRPGSGSRVLTRPSCSGSILLMPTYREAEQDSLLLLKPKNVQTANTLSENSNAAHALYNTMSCPRGGRLSTSPRSIWAFCTACILVLMVPIKACCAELCTFRKIKGLIPHRETLLINDNDHTCGNNCKICRMGNNQRKPIHMPAIL